MAIYDFKCMKCQSMVVDLIMPITHLASAVPRCCDQFMAYHISSPPMVLWKDPNIEAFRHVAVKDSPLITSTKQNREFMARNNLVDANETFALPTAHEEKMAREASQESIDAISGTAQQREQLKQQGIDSIIEQ